MAWLAQGGLASVLDVAGGIACQPLRSRSCATAELIRLKKIQIGPAFPMARRDFLLRLRLSRRLRPHSIYPERDPNMSSYRRSRAQPHRTCLVRRDDEPTRSDHGPRGAPSVLLSSNRPPCRKAQNGHVLRTTPFTDLANVCIDIQLDGNWRRARRSVLLQYCRIAGPNHRGYQAQF